MEITTDFPCDYLPLSLSAFCLFLANYMVELAICPRSCALKGQCVSPNLENLLFHHRMGEIAKFPSAFQSHVFKGNTVLSSLDGIHFDIIFSRGGNAKSLRGSWVFGRKKGFWLERNQIWAAKKVLSSAKPLANSKKFFRARGRLICRLTGYDKMYALRDQMLCYFTIAASN